MIAFPGYSVTEELYKGERSVVARASRLSDGQRVILKILPDRHPDPLDVERLRNEAEILADLDIPGAPRCFGVEEKNRRLALVLEDEGALALDRILDGKPLDLDAFFAIALDLITYCCRKIDFF